MHGIFSPSHLIILLIVGFLIFGKRLPELGRSLAKSIVEFKKGMQGLEDEVPAQTAVRNPQVTAEPITPPQRVVPTAPRFEDAPTPPRA
jgi:sec-independent protein translocase protein TatA